MLPWLIKVYIYILFFKFVCFIKNSIRWSLITNEWNPFILLTNTLSHHYPVMRWIVIKIWNSWNQLIVINRHNSSRLMDIFFVCPGAGWIIFYFNFSAIFTALLLSNQLLQQEKIHIYWFKRQYLNQPENKKRFTHEINTTITNIMWNLAITGNCQRYQLEIYWIAFQWWCNIQSGL